MSCPKRCGASLERRRVTDHSLECVNRLTACTHCGHQVVYNHMSVSTVFFLSVAANHGQCIACTELNQSTSKSPTINKLNQIHDLIVLAVNSLGSDIILYDFLSLPSSLRFPAFDNSCIPNILFRTFCWSRVLKFPGALPAGYVIQSYACCGVQ